MKKKTNNGLKIICLNRKASFNFFFEDLIEAGIVLKGSEIKSIRDGKVNIADSYAVEKGGELVLINSHISSYKQASYSNHNPTDDRKLLLNKKEINKLIGKMQRDGFTKVPSINIIDFDYVYWHTIKDTPENVSKNSLSIVGSVLTDFIYSYDKNIK